MEAYSPFIKAGLGAKHPSLNDFLFIYDPNLRNLTKVKLREGYGGIFPIYKSRSVGEAPQV